MLGHRFTTFKLSARLKSIHALANNNSDDGEFESNFYADDSSEKLKRGTGWEHDGGGAKVEQCHFGKVPNFLFIP